jgi:hypothetical protein
VKRPGQSAGDPGVGSEPPVVRCPLCNSATRLEPNAFYGTGLSVHRQVRMCEQCHWMTVFGDEDLADNAAPAGTSPRGRRSVFRWFAPRSRS